VKTACVVNRLSPKDKSEASRFHGGTVRQAHGPKQSRRADGPLFGAAVKKKDTHIRSMAYSRFRTFHYGVAPKVS
jgi:hypothetical protein